MSHFADWSNRVKFLATLWNKDNWKGSGHAAYIAWEHEWDGHDGAW